MENTSKNKIFYIIVLAVVLIVILGFFIYKSISPATTTNFAECSSKYPIMETYPRQCKSPDGKTFVEDIGNELAKDDLIRIGSPRPNTKISSPLKITGMARGSWYFEASFPVQILDANKNIIAQAPAQAKSDWMTTDFVPFELTLDFKDPTTTTGFLVLKKDNPSGIPEKDDQLIIPIVFGQTDVTL
ncbi:MAG: Gmad2 immunoglobulin-like domain-containing protein [Candidatus Paceibacterota bacterium]|jgi:hypothetical protein